MNNLPKSIFELIDLEQFRTKTAMYLGDKKISALDSFINGYFYAIWTNQIEADDPYKFDEFNNWIENYYGTNSTAGWRRLILSECDGDEEKALDRFFDLYDEFKKR